MQPPTVRIFVSSTWLDLQPERRAVEVALQGMRETKFNGMEYSGSRDENTLHASLDEVDRSQVYVGIFGGRYGSGITEHEYRRARERGLPCFIYQRSEEHIPTEWQETDKEKALKLAELREELRRTHTVTIFTNPDELAVKVTADLHRWLFDEYLEPKLERGAQRELPHEEIQVLLESIRDLSALNHDLLTRLQTAGYIVPSPLHSLLTSQEFLSRAEHAALTSHHGALIGREAALAEVKTHLLGSARVIVLHGPGGIGKTRLLLALPNVVPGETSLWYVRLEAAFIERDLTKLDRNRQHVIVLDDAHRFGLLSQLHEVLVNPDLAGNVKIVLATRSVFKDAVTYRLGSLPGDRVGEIELRVLMPADIDRILQNPPYMIGNEGIRYALVRIAEGNALIASIAARLVERGTPITSFTRDQVLTRYLDEIIRDLAEANYDDRYIGLLQVLAALGTLDLSNQPLREKVQQVIGISQLEEDRIVGRLREAGIIESYWLTLKIASEVLADHILISHFFDHRTKRADYQRQIIDPFFDLKPKEILSKLAEAEAKGEASEAGLLLGQKLDDLYRIVDDKGNIARAVVLEWLGEVAYIRPDDILRIVARVVDGPEQPPESHHDSWFGPLEFTHEMVLDHAVQLLGHSIDHGNLRDVVSYLYKLARYRPEAQEYIRIRNKAHETLVKIAEFKPHKAYEVQLTLLEMIRMWLEQDFGGNSDLCLALIQPMLRMEFRSAEADPTKPFAIAFQRWMFRPNEQLSRIREQALDILY
jgi:hypothetical protein